MTFTIEATIVSLGVPLSYGNRLNHVMHVALNLNDKCNWNRIFFKQMLYLINATEF